MRRLLHTLRFWAKTFAIAWKRSRPTLKRLPFYFVGILVAYFWRHETQEHLIFPLLAIPVVWAITMLAQLLIVPAELCELSAKRRHLKEIALRLMELYDKGNDLAALPGDVTDDIAAEQIPRIEQWRSDARAAVSKYSLSESILFDTIATDHLRNLQRYDRAKPKRDTHLAAVLVEMNKLRLIASRASQEAEEVEQKIQANRIEPKAS